MNGPSERSKICTEHVRRLAFVYVRQSSLRQVRNNLESQRRQYAFADQAVDMGWSRDRIVVVDEDQGKTGAIPDSRAGFGNLVSAVARGEVGIVMSLELSRLSRNDADWNHLVYLCRWSGALIADEQGVYDPSSGADRMVLGIRGQVSEMERDSLVHRMVEARWNKARRGEAVTIPPAGYDLDDLGQVVMTSDEAVQSAIRRVFEKFDELGAARQVFLWWRSEALPFPVRRTQPGHPIAWTAVCSRLVLQMLRHPIYAGIFVFGRSHTVRTLDPETQRIVVRRGVRSAMKDWPVMIQEHHPAYISLDKYLGNQRRLRENSVMQRAATDESHAGAAREGDALLQGILRCSHCGRRMYVNYGGAVIKRTLQYRCSRRFVTQAPDVECQLVGGKRIEVTVVAAFLAATADAGFEAAALAGEQLRAEIDSAERSWLLLIEKAEYEAKRAERQYAAVEPENRTVVRELERRWNERLEELDAIRAKAVAARQHRRPLSEQEITEAQALGRNLDAVWNAPTTTSRDRKRLLRALIEEVQIRTDQTRHVVRIVWKGGATTDRELVRAVKGGAALHATAGDIIVLVRKLAHEFDDAQIARILNRQGRRSGLGLAFTKSSVSSLRHHHGISACTKKKPRDEREGPFSADEAARELGVTASTVHHWLREGVLAGEQATPRAPWRILLSEDVRRRLVGGDVPSGWVGLAEAAKRLGVGKSLVAYWVKRGKLHVEGARHIAHVRAACSHAGPARPRPLRAPRRELRARLVRAPHLPMARSAAPRYRRRGRSLLRRRSRSGDAARLPRANSATRSRLLGRPWPRDRARAPPRGHPGRGRVVGSALHGARHPHRAQDDRPLAVHGGDHCAQHHECAEWLGAGLRADGAWDHRLARPATELLRARERDRPPALDRRLLGRPGSDHPGFARAGAGGLLGRRPGAALRRMRPLSAPRATGRVLERTARVARRTCGAPSTSTQPDPAAPDSPAGGVGRASRSLRVDAAGNGRVEPDFRKLRRARTRGSARAVVSSPHGCLCSSAWCWSWWSPPWSSWRSSGRGSEWTS
jgi:DNA invertase Pin-like site-specific DNA recombinase